MNRTMPQCITDQQNKIYDFSSKYVPQRNTINIKALHVSFLILLLLLIHDTHYVLQGAPDVLVVYAVVCLCSVCVWGSS